MGVEHTIICMAIKKTAACLDQACTSHLTTAMRSCHLPGHAKRN
jgi:hypothetical protein